MDPELGRFITEDSYKGDPGDPLTLNFYTYCTNNPLLYNDPTGHEKNVVTVGATGADVQNMGYMATVTKGDTLWSLAEKYYGDGNLGFIIAAANGLEIDKNGVCNLQIDSSLYIPAMAGDKNTPNFKYGFGFLDQKQYARVTSDYQHSEKTDNIYIETEYSKGGVTATYDELYLLPFVGATYRYGATLKALGQGAIDTVIGEITGLGLQKGSETLFKFYMYLADRVNVSTGVNQAVFYSGAANRKLATEFAEQNGKMILERTPGGAFFERLNCSCQYII